LTTKSYVDAASSGVGDLETVLEAGNDARGESIIGVSDMTVTGDINVNCVKAGNHQHGSLQCYSGGDPDLYMGVSDAINDTRGYQLNGNVGTLGDFGLNINAKRPDKTFEPLISINSSQHSGGKAIDFLEIPLKNCGKVNVDDVTESTTIGTGSITSAGGLGIAKNTNIGGTLVVNSASNESITTEGGLYVKKSIIIDQNFLVSGDGNFEGKVAITGDVTGNRFIGGSSTGNLIILSPGTIIDSVVKNDVGPGFSRSYVTQNSGTYNLTVSIPINVINTGNELTFLFNKWTLTGSTFNVIISCNNNVFNRAGQPLNQFYGTAFDGGLSLSKRYTVVKVICCFGRAYAYIAHETD